MESPVALEPYTDIVERDGGRGTIAAIHMLKW